MLVLRCLQFSCSFPSSCAVSRRCSFTMFLKSCRPAAALVLSCKAETGLVSISRLKLWECNTEMDNMALQGSGQLQKLKHFLYVHFMFTEGCPLSEASLCRLSISDKCSWWTYKHPERTLRPCSSSKDVTL